MRPTAFPSSQFKLVPPNWMEPPALPGWRKRAVAAIWSTMQAVEEGALDGVIHW